MQPVDDAGPEEPVSHRSDGQSQADDGGSHRKSNVGVRRFGETEL